MSRLRRRAEEDETVCYPGQYDNADESFFAPCYFMKTISFPIPPGVVEEEGIKLRGTDDLYHEQNWKSHERWTGAQILRQLPEIDIFCTTVGTGGKI